MNDQDGKGCAQTFALFGFACMCGGVGLGVLITILLRLWLS